MGRNPDDVSRSAVSRSAAAKRAAAGAGCALLAVATATAVVVSVGMPAAAVPVGSGPNATVAAHTRAVQPSPPTTQSSPPTTRAVQPTTPSSAKLPGTNCRVFPASSFWHADVSHLPVDPHSADWLANTGAGSRRLHPDFGPSFGEQPVPYGIPVTVVHKKRPKTKVRFGYASESDRVRYPLNKKTKIEGGPRAAGDRHTIVVNATTCKLYETWDTHLRSGGWYAGSGAVWSLRSNALRPAGWTSADAAGLAILPGLLRWDEVTRGRVDHAIRMTVPSTRDSYLWPARHRAGDTSSAAYPPMGARFRLKASFTAAGYSTRAKVIISAMKRYGTVVADNGSAWYFQGTADTHWPAALMDELKRIPSGQFEAVNTAPLRVSANSGAARR